MEASPDMIKEGLRRFKGLKGRTSLKTEGDLCIIEEINPGINTTTIRKSAEMLADLPKVQWFSEENTELPAKK